jgi:hypothetical protein
VRDARLQGRPLAFQRRLARRADQDAAGDLFGFAEAQDRAGLRVVAVPVRDPVGPEAHGEGGVQQGGAGRAGRQPLLPLRDGTWPRAGDDEDRQRRDLELAELGGQRGVAAASGDRLQPRNERGLGVFFQHHEPPGAELAMIWNARGQAQEFGDLVGAGRRSLERQGRGRAAQRQEPKDLRRRRHRKRRAEFGRRGQTSFQKLGQPSRIAREPVYGEP